MQRFFALLLCMSTPAAAENVAGEFDYYVLSLSWSPNWCDLEGRAKGSSQCNEGAGFGWVMHGLWPQYEDGWPANCPTTARNPTRAQTNAMADIMGTSGLAWYQWKKHGVCAGLAAEDFYSLARLAYEKVNRPQVFRRLERDVTLPAAVVEDAFLRDNPDLRADQITITCKAGAIQEARICLTRDLEYRTCGTDVIRDCRMQNAAFSAID